MRITSAGCRVAVPPLASTDYRDNKVRQISKKSLIPVSNMFSLILGRDSSNVILNQRPNCLIHTIRIGRVSDSRRLNATLEEVNLSLQAIKIIRKTGI